MQRTQCIVEAMVRALSSTHINSRANAMWGSPDPTAKLVSVTF